MVQEVRNLLSDYGMDDRSLCSALSDYLLSYFYASDVIPKVLSQDRYSSESATQVSEAMSHSRNRIMAQHAAGKVIMDFINHGISNRSSPLFRNPEWSRMAILRARRIIQGFSLDPARQQALMDQLLEILAKES